MLSHDRAHVFPSCCLVIGQCIEFTSTFFWLENGRHDINGSVLVILGMVFWSVGFVGLFSMFRENNPWYARLGLLYAFYGVLGGIAFGFEGLFSQLFGVEKAGVDAFERFPLQLNLVLFWAGPAFPLSLLVLGVMIMVRKVQPWWIGLFMCIGAVAFPVSRIMRIAWVGHAADLILLVPLVSVLLISVMKNRVPVQV